MCSTSRMLPVLLLAGIARALRMPSGNMLNAVAEPAACAAERRKSRRFFEVMVLAFDLHKRNEPCGASVSHSSNGARNSIYGLDDGCGERRRTGIRHPHAAPSVPPCCA